MSDHASEDSAEHGKTGDHEVATVYASTRILRLFRAANEDRQEIEAILVRLEGEGGESKEEDRSRVEALMDRVREFGMEADAWFGEKGHWRAWIYDWRERLAAITKESNEWIEPTAAHT
jgi:hypothetical protein